MDQAQSSNQTTAGRTTGSMKRTLNLTSLLVNAMALIAPGAFLWTTFQVQAAQTNGGVTTAGEMWTGLLAALVLAFLTAISYAELANIYPKAATALPIITPKPRFLKKKRAVTASGRGLPSSWWAGYRISTTGFIPASWWPFRRS